MALSVLFWFLSILASSASAYNFPFEAIQLTEADVGNFSAVQFGDASLPPQKSETPVCRAFPGSADWPSVQDWSRLNATLRGALLRPLPAAAVCYQSIKEWSGQAKTTASNASNASNAINASSTASAATYNLAKCLQLQFGGLGPRSSLDDPLAVMTSWPQGDTCNMVPWWAATSRRTCARGGSPDYVVNVSTVQHVQAAINFARNKNVRLVIKNTGHDFVGRSTGAGSLSVWTHHLKQFEFLPHFTYDNASLSPPPYSGMAARVGAGLEAWELYRYMEAHNMTLVVPGGQTVGAYGGWTAGGGHSSLGSAFGLGSDQVLSLQVVTADGQFVTADPYTNTDLFFALRGGGGGTFGVVTSAVVRAYPAVTVAESRLSFQYAGGLGGGFNWTGPGLTSNASLFGNGSFPGFPPGNVSFPGFPGFPGNNSSMGNFSFPRFIPPIQISDADTFWAAVSAYFHFGQQLCDGGNTGYSYLSALEAAGNSTLVFLSFSTTLEFPGRTPASVEHFLQPLVDSLRRLSVVVPPAMTKATVSLSWGPGPQQGASSTRSRSLATHPDPGPDTGPDKDPDTDDPLYPSSHFATRLFPRRNWADASLFNQTMQALRDVVEAGYAFHGVQVAPALHLPSVALLQDWDAVNPAFRHALLHGDVFDRLGPAAETSQTGLSTLEAAMARLRTVTPGSGAYVNEADPQEPDWQQSFWGAHYERLLGIKRARDPWGVFWAPTTVGSEAWRVVKAAEAAEAEAAEAEALASLSVLSTQNGRLCRVPATGWARADALDVRRRKQRREHAQHASTYTRRRFTGPRHE